MKIFKLIHLIFIYLIFIFPINLILLYTRANIHLGYTPNTLHTEATDIKILVSHVYITLYSLGISAISILIVLILSFVMYKLNNKVTKKTWYVIFVGILLNIILIYFNVFHLYSWFMS